MATAVGEVVQAEVQLDLEALVKRATWRELLVELVDTRKLDPWNINIEEIVDSYVSVIKTLQVMDLYVPANMVLAASILLRMKSDLLVLPSDEVLMSEPAIDEAAAARVIPEVPQLSFRSRLQPGRRVTLGELLDALDGAMRIEKARSMTAMSAAPSVSLPTDIDDIDDRLEETMALVASNVDVMGMTTFSNLERAAKLGDESLLYLFVPLLYLATRDRLVLAQDDFFSEIFVRLCDGGNGGPYQV